MKNNTLRKNVVPMLYLKTKLPCNYLNYKAIFLNFCGLDGTRTRDLRRDRAAF